MTRLRRPEALVALGVIGLGMLALFETTRIPVSPMYARVGPTVMAYAASALLIGLGAALLAQAWRGQWESEPEAAAAPLNLRAAGWLLLGLALNAGLIAPLGFVPASILLFACTARAFGSRKPLRDIIVGAVFAAIAYFGFARLLGINIGAGVMEGWI
ncbi:MAG: tripartite tricarboxylate transporter TctB family protein [Ferrovibrio sp.]|uniref:tripartite tricarboxylate transporter TctB family protein n=1 Tax=Ferrovibrio sp. TaxID=1917215 RepID=UPI0039189C62